MKLSKLEKNIKYEFKDKKLLELALTHSSYSNENKEFESMNNERLEFLGDSVLSLAISNYIYNNYKELPEGDMTKIRANIVCEETLAKVATKIKLEEYIKLGKGEEMTGGRERHSILSDAVEATISAIYLDGGFEEAEKVILTNMKQFIEESIKEKGNNDYKTRLQEQLQQHGDVKIIYEVIETEGPDHDKKFKVKVTCNGEKLGIGEGHSKKEAEQYAAKKALKI